MRINIDLSPDELTPEFWVDGELYSHSSPKVGDFVRVGDEYGEIVVIDPSTGPFGIGVKFAEYHAFRHDLGGWCRAGHGWWYNSNDLKVVA